MAVPGTDSKGILFPMMTVGSYRGDRKPSDVSEFFKQTITDLIALMNEDIKFGNVYIAVYVASVLCDVSAHTFIPQVKPSIGYYVCDKCTLRGLHCDQPVTCPDINSKLFENCSFYAKNIRDFP